MGINKQAMEIMQDEIASLCAMKKKQYERNQELLHENDALKAHIERLKKVLKAVMTGESYKDLRVLSETPPQSLAAHDREVERKTVARCADTAMSSCLAPPDGGMPTEDEINHAHIAASAIAVLPTKYPEGKQ